MKKVIFLLMLAGIMSSCSQDETPQIIGKWKLIAFLDDPGDGNGTFQSVDSEQTIDFFNDGTVVRRSSNWCGDGSEISATYSIEQSIIFVDCEDYISQYQFYLQKSKLIIQYNCLEGCKGMYIKIE